MSLAVDCPAHLDTEAGAFGSNTVDVYLARLRSKIAGDGLRIETVRGVGYRIVAS